MLLLDSWINHPHIHSFNKKNIFLIKKLKNKNKNENKVKKKKKKVKIKKFIWNNVKNINLIMIGGWVME